MNEPVDLSSCDREPIHVPGAIQPHGMLLAFGAHGLEVRSANARQLGALPAPLREEIDALLGDPARVPAALTTELDGRTYDVVPYRSGGLVVVELERRDVSGDALEALAFAAQRAIFRIQRIVERDAMLRAVAEEVRALTGFDRVMVYRFQPDDSGLVDAEARRADLEPFLGLRYPASDIPAQARRLYVLNPLRLIADIAYQPVPLEPPLVPSTGAPLDLSHSMLRSVSPIHVEYLTNMGVQASMSISIVIDGKLWGLIACHHMTPRLVSYAVRMACQLMAEVVSALVDRVETARAAAELERTLATHTALVRRIARLEDVVHELTTTTPHVLDLVTADGAVATFGDDVATLGRTPDQSALRTIVAYLRTREDVEVFATSHAAVDCPTLGPALGELCGFLAMRFSAARDGYVIWFRGEQRELVRWGGNPQKEYAIGPLGPRLTPRGSFAEWRETVVGRSLPWTERERASAERLRHELRELTLEQARRRILALEESNSELDRLAYVVSHDLRAPLRGIANLFQFMEEDLRAGKVDEALDMIALLRARTVKLDALIVAILGYTRAGQQRQKPRLVDVADIVRDSIELLAVPSGVRIEVTPALPSMVTHGPLLQQVFMNLLGNALKYGLRDGGGTIYVGATEHGDAWEFSVRDEGEGIDPAQQDRVFRLFSRISTSAAGTGVGLAIVNRIVQAHGGRVWVDSTPGQGATFSFTWAKDDPV